MNKTEIDCPSCGSTMLWKYLKDPICPSCDVESVEKIYSKKSDQSHAHPLGTTNNQQPTTNNKQQTQA